MLPISELTLTTTAVLQKVPAASRSAPMRVLPLRYVLKLQVERLRAYDAIKYFPKTSQEQHLTDF